MKEPIWTCKQFNQLTGAEVYMMLQLRNLVFVVEQQCVYNDTDDKDLHCHHILGMSEGKLLAYTRIVPPGLSYQEPAIGRFVTAPSVRRAGLGKELMKKTLSFVNELYGSTNIRISAQSYLINFYQSFDFQTVGEPYEEDGIPHTEMLFSA